MRQSPILAPKRLFLQILELQLVYYVIGFILISFLVVVAGLKWQANYLFSWENVRADTSLGWQLALLQLLSTFFTVIGLAVIVGRSKLAWDFALTLHGIHFIVVLFTSGSFPMSWLWWATQIISASLLLILGTWTTQWRELKKTFFEDYEMVDLAHEERVPKQSGAPTGDSA